MLLKILRIKYFIDELRRRHVFRVGAAYIVGAWLLIEVADILTDTYNAPEWVMQAVVPILALGFPLAIILAWAYQLTPEGIVEDAEAKQQEKFKKIKAMGHTTSIAILPLDHIGKGQEGRYIADGIAEDITTLLSRTPGLFVIARNSASRYKVSEQSIGEFAQSLGVRYVTEGSLRQMGDQLRLNIQLIEADSETHIWAQKFDFPKGDIFKQTEDISNRISTQLVSSLEKAESNRAQLMPAHKVDAWLLTQRAIHEWWSGPDEEKADEAFRLINEALKKDPDYAYALAFHGFLCIIAMMMGIKHGEDHYRELGLKSIQAALKVAPDDPFVLYYWGTIQGFTGNMDRAVTTLKRAGEGNPNDPHILVDLGFFLVQTGKKEEGIALIKKAFILSPHEPRSYVWHLYLGSAYGALKPLDALAEYEKSITLFNRYIPGLAAKLIILGVLGREEEARKTGKVLHELHPDLKLSDLTRLYEMSIKGKADRALIYEMLDKYAGDLED